MIVASGRLLSNIRHVPIPAPGEQAGAAGGSGKAAGSIARRPVRSTKQTAPPKETSLDKPATAARE
jgi:hypothetical protein